MSEKRFSVRLRSECDGVVYSFFDGDKPLDVDMIVELLNEQSDTIEGLILDRNRQEEKLDIARRNMSKQLEKIEELEKENEQLRQQLKTICNTCCYDCEEKWCEK